MDWIGYIERLINQYDKVILVATASDRTERQLIMDMPWPADQEIVVLFSEEAGLEADQGDVALSFKEAARADRSIAFEKIPWEAVAQLVSLYHTYAFTDNMILLEENPAYPSIDHYVRTGLLTAEEAWQALLR